MVDIYLESLQPRITSEWKKTRKKNLKSVSLKCLLMMKLKNNAMRLPKLLQMLGGGKKPEGPSGPVYKPFHLKDGNMAVNPN